MSHKTTLEHNFFLPMVDFLLYFRPCVSLMNNIYAALISCKSKAWNKYNFGRGSKTSQIHFPQPRVLSWKSVSMQLKPPLGERLCCTRTLTELYTWVNITHMLPLFISKTFTTKKHILCRISLSTYNTMRKMEEKLHKTNTKWVSQCESKHEPTSGKNKQSNRKYVKKYKMAIFNLSNQNFYFLA
jgi:hypothetical protein